MLEKAQRDAESIVRDARLAANEEALKLREQTEQSFAARRQKRAELERRLSERETLINAQLEKIVQAEKNLQEQKDGLQKQAESLDGAAAGTGRADTGSGASSCRSLSHLTESRGAGAVFEGDRAGSGAGRRPTCPAASWRRPRRARRKRPAQIISVAIQRYAGEHTFETTTATIALQGEDMKGRIIGRDGRNIRAFEAATGVTVLIDDTPNAVVLSGFDPVRREIAREAMARLILDGRIHPTRIEEVVAKVNAGDGRNHRPAGRGGGAQGGPAADARGNRQAAGAAAFPAQLLRRTCWIIRWRWRI